MIENLSLQERALAIGGLLVALVVVAYVGILIYGKVTERRQIRDLNADLKATGTKYGASRGQDETHDPDWFARVHAARPADEERMAWRDALLGPGAVHHEDGTEMNLGGTPTTGVTGHAAAPEITSAHMPPPSTETR